jgi:uncharacterized protein YraI
MKHGQLKSHSTRLLTLVLAMMVLVAPACGGAQTPVSAVITAPDATAALMAGQEVNIQGRATGSGLKSVDVFVDGVKHATVDTPAQENEFLVSAPWTPGKAGAHVIQLKGMDEKGEVLVASEAVFVNVQGQPATATAPPPTPASTEAVPTAAPAAATAVVTATVATTTTAQGPTASVKEGGDFVNVRKGPATTYDKLGTLDLGQSAPVIGKNADASWWQIRFPAAPDGVGWLIGTLVNINGDASAVPVVQAPPLPTTAPNAATATAPAAAAATATPGSSLPASALLPYSQSMRFSPRDNIGDVPLGHEGESKTSTLVWEVNGAKSLELEITTQAGTGIYQNCPVGNLGSVSPNDAVGKRKPLQVPSGSYQFTINDKGYYVFTIHVVKTNGSVEAIPRAVIVDCYKTQ